MELNYLIPNLYLPIISCYKKVRFTELDAVICTTTGQLITFHKQEPVSFCNIVNHCVSDILTFNIYSPYVEYFILKSNDGNVVIVINESQPKICQIFEGILEIEIGDFWGTGSPQIKLLTNDGCSFVTNFLITTQPTCNISHKRQTKFAISLNNHLHQLLSHVRLAEEALQMKKRLRKVMIKTLFNESIELNAAHRQSLFKFSIPFKKIINEQWCIFFVLKNMSRLSLRNVRVSLRSCTNLGIYRVRWFYRHCNMVSTFTSADNKFDFVRPVFDHLVLPYVPYIIVISLPLNTFIKKTTILIKSTLWYEIENEILLVNMPKFNLNLSDLNCPKIRILESDGDKAHLFDILSIITTSVMARFKIIIQSFQPINIHHIFLRCGCKNIDSTISKYLYPSSSITNDILLCIKLKNSSELLLEMYAKNEHDHVYFLLKLHSHLPPNGCKIILTMYNYRDRTENGISHYAI